MLKWFRSLLLVGLIFVFTTILTSAQQDGGELEDGVEVDIEVDGEDELVFTYDGSEGDVISVLVQADDDTDTRMTLYNEDGDEIASDDDSGPGLNPAFARVVLPDDGEYTIEITHYSGDEELDDEFEVTLFEVDLLDAGEGPVELLLGDDFELDRVVFEAEEDVQYLVILTARDDYDSTLYVEVLEEDDTFANVRFDMAGTLRAGFLFEASDDGIVSLELEYFGFSDEIEVRVEVDALEE